MPEGVMRKLPVSYVEKIWGIDRLPPPFPHPAAGPIGEIWFDPPAELSELLVKYIFAGERLSVQAHPDDAQARALGLGQSGKSESWVILDAEPGATIAVGFREEISPEHMRSAAIDGSIVDLLAWHEVTRGDVFYLPPGTVHAIGGGVGLIEVQQNCDITLRLFDYGRPRELHLDQAMEIADPQPHPAHLRQRMAGNSGVLVDGPRFRLAFWQCGSAASLPELDNGQALLVPFAGSVATDSDTLTSGECALIDAQAIANLTGNAMLLIAQPVRRQA